MIAPSRNETYVWAGLTTVILLFISLPILLVVVISFSASSTIEFPPPGLSMRWYAAAYDLFTSEDLRTDRFRESVYTTMTISSITAVCAVAIGTPAAYALVRLQFRWKPLVEQLVSLPLIFPLLVLGIALLVLSSTFGITNGYFRIIVAHIIVTFPFVVRNCMASLRGVSSSLEESARTLGANWMQVTTYIVLPLVRPGIFSGALLAFIISFNEFTVAYFLYTVDVYPFSIWLFSKGANSLNLVIFPIAAFVILIDGVLIWLLSRIGGKYGVSL